MIRDLHLKSVDEHNKTLSYFHISDTMSEVQ